jgi:hypothetical protein
MEASTTIAPRASAATRRRSRTAADTEPPATTASSVWCSATACRASAACEDTDYREAARFQHRARRSHLLGRSADDHHGPVSSHQPEGKTSSELEVKRPGGSSLSPATTVPGRCGPEDRSSSVWHLRAPRRSSASRAAVLVDVPRRHRPEKRAPGPQPRRARSGRRAGAEAETSASRQGQPSAVPGRCSRLTRRADTRSLGPPRDSRNNPRRRQADQVVAPATACRALADDDP